MTGNDEAALAFRSAVHQLARRSRQLKAFDDVTDGQMSVLAELHDAGPTTPGALALRDDVSPPAMNRTVNALERAGAVRRVPHPDDGRRVLVEITDAGTRLVLETRGRRNAWMAAEFSALSDEDRAVLVRATELMRGMGRR